MNPRIRRTLGGWMRRLGVLEGKFMSEVSYLVSGGIIMIRNGEQSN